MLNDDVYADVIVMSERFEQIEEGVILHARPGVLCTYHSGILVTSH